jgi:hypothetical protein
MSKKPSVTVRNINNIKTLHLYVFSVKGRKPEALFELFIFVMKYLNPDISDYLTRLKKVEIDIKATEINSKENASLEIANFLDKMNSSRLQAFIQPCEVAVPGILFQKKISVWLVSYIEDARSLLEPKQSQIIFTAGCIGFSS